MRSLLKYMDPTRPIRWAFGRTASADDLEAWREAKVVVVFGNGSIDGAPNEATTVKNWVTGAGYEVFDWRGEDEVDPCDGLAEIEARGVKRAVVFADSEPLVAELHSRGLQVAGVIQVGFLVAPELRGVKTYTVRVTHGNVLGVISEALGEPEPGAEAFQIGSGDEDCVEMPEKNPVVPLVSRLKNPDTISCLLVVAENLLYKSCEEKYRVLYQSDRFDSIIGKYSEATELLTLFGFEYHGPDSAHPNTWRFHGDDVDSHTIHLAIRDLNKQMGAISKRARER